jgi:hypothetical protein
MRNFALANSEVSQSALAILEKIKKRAKCKQTNNLKNTGNSKGMPNKFIYQKPYVFYGDMGWDSLKG